MNLFNFFNFNTAKATDESAIKLPAWVCASDAAQRNRENLSLYTQSQVQFGQALLEMVESTYERSKVYINYRKKFIAVKVNSPTFSDKLSLSAIRLDASASAMGIDRVVTRHGNIVYRVSKDLLEKVYTDAQAEAATAK